MKKLFTVILIIVILLPMLIYLNPFTWGMRQSPLYKESMKTKVLISKLNTKYDLNVKIGSNADTLWYFIDVRNENIQPKNFKLYNDFSFSQQPINKTIFDNFANEFINEFEHKQYFDSIIITKDTLKYKYKIQ